MHGAISLYGFKAVRLEIMASPKKVLTEGVKQVKPCFFYRMRQTLLFFVIMTIMLPCIVVAEQETSVWNCPNCHNQASGNFCSVCGTIRPTSESDPIPWYIDGKKLIIPMPVSSSGKPLEFDQELTVETGDFSITAISSTYDDFVKYRAELIKYGFTTIIADQENMFRAEDSRGNIVTIRRNGMHLVLNGNYYSASPAVKDPWVVNHIKLNITKPDLVSGQEPLYRTYYYNGDNPDSMFVIDVVNASELDMIAYRKKLLKCGFPNEPFDDGTYIATSSNDVFIMIRYIEFSIQFEGQPFDGMDNTTTRSASETHISITPSPVPATPRPTFTPNPSSNSDQSKSVNIPTSFSGPKVKVTAGGRTYTIRKDFRDAMDALEEYFDEYIETARSQSTAEFLMHYTSLMAEIEEFTRKMEAIDDMTNDEIAYYTYVFMRINNDLVNAMH